jgi:hypothetical protein
MKSSIQGEPMRGNKSYVWYIGYGSNLCEERFICYIKGGKFKWGGSKTRRCTDKSPPKENKPIQISHRLYFAKNSISWENGGVAFITPDKELNENNWTWGRMWKITKEQYEQVRDQEGGTWYNHEIKMGEEDCVPVYTITNKDVLTPNICPSEGYLKTIALGLKETFCLANDEIFRYLKEKAGIKGQWNDNELMRIIESVTSYNSRLKD